MFEDENAWPHTELRIRIWFIKMCIPNSTHVSIFRWCLLAYTYNAYTLEGGRRVTCGARCQEREGNSIQSS